MSLLLEGEVVNHGEELESLRGRIAELECELEEVRTESAREKKRNAVALAAIRRQLSPLHQALKALFGELDKFGFEEVSSTPSGNSKWEAVKQGLAPRLRQCIDLLLLQGSMKRTQVAAALKMDYSNCTKNVIQVLKQSGWIVEDNGNLRLKEL